MKAEHLDEQPSITNIDDERNVSEILMWLKWVADRNEGLTHSSIEKAEDEIREIITNKIKEAELRGRKEHFEEIVPDEGVDEDSKGSFADGYSKAVEDICDAHFARLTQLTNQHKGESENA